MNPVMNSFFEESLLTRAKKRDEYLRNKGILPSYEYDAAFLIQHFNERNYCVQLAPSITDIIGHYEQLGDHQYWPVGFTWDYYINLVNDKSKDQLKFLDMQPGEKFPSDVDLNLVQLDLVKLIKKERVYEIDQYTIQDQLGNELYGVDHRRSFNYIKQSFVESNKFHLVGQLMPRTQGMRMLDIVVIRDGSGDQPIEKLELV